MSDAPLVPSGRSLSAILCADVHGYSRLMAKNEVRTYEQVNRSIQLIRSRIGDYSGRVANVAGDGLIALFQTAPQALEFALTIQSEFDNQAVSHLDHDPITFRIGISHGEVFVDEGNVQGHSVNVAARIQALARPGGICVTDVVHQAAGARVGGTVRSLGLKYLKNIDEPIEVFAVDPTGAETAAAPGPTAAASLRLSRPTVAVEPFQALSGSQDEIYIALAMSESLVQALARFNWLAVKEDRSSGLVTPVLGELSARASPPAEGGYMVAGRVLRIHRSLRLVAQLREHPNRRIIWSSSFDLRAGRTFKRLDELAKILAAQLERQVLMAEVGQAWEKPPESLGVHDYVMRAIPLMFQMSRGSLRDAERFLRAADEGAPRSSRIQALRAFATLLKIGQQWVPDPTAAVEEIEWLTRSAIEYSPIDSLALALRGHVESFIFHRFDRALDCFDRALQSNPSEPFCWGFSAVTLSYLGRTSEAMARLQRYQELCPLDPYPFYFNTAFTLTYALAGEYAQAVEVGRRVVAENPNYFAAYRPLITSLGRLGQVDEARALLAKLLANEPQFSIGWFRAKYPPLSGDRLEQYLKGFREIGVPED